MSSELAGYGAEAPWFSLGDKDIATHLMRTRMLDAGYPLSDVTSALCERWQPGVTLLPMTDDRVETHVVVEDPAPSERAAAPRRAGAPPLIALHFQEWWIRYQASLPALSITADRRRGVRPGTGRAGRDRRRRPGVDRAVEPGGVHRHRSSRCPASPTPCARRPLRSSGFHR